MGPPSSRYRRLGADPPFGDPRRGHGVSMEGYFWRLTDAERGLVVIALCGVCRAPDGTWATVALAVDPHRVLEPAIAAPALAHPGRLAVDVGDTFTADEEHLSVQLPGARLEVDFRERRPWPRRLAGGLGVAHWIPGLGQYWHPHLLDARADGELVLGEERIALAGARVYAEKNWGSAFPQRWWWGEAHDFGGDDVGVAFAGGRLLAGVHASALVVRLGDELIRLSAPGALVRADADQHHWRLHGRGPRHTVVIDAEASGPPFALPVPIPSQRRHEPNAQQQLAGHLRLEVRRGRRLRFAGTTSLAGLEYGS